MKTLFTLLILFGLQNVMANEMPTNPTLNETETLDQLELLFEEGEMATLKNPLTGEITGFKFSHDSLIDSETLSFSNGETVEQ